MNAYWKMLHCDLENGAVSERPWSVERHLGGRGLTSRWLLEHLDPACRPLGPENVLIFATGLLGGSGASSSYRLSAGGKSPLTGGIKESSSGGMAGFALSELGIRALILHGAAEQLSLLHLGPQGARLRSCPELFRRDLYTTASRLKEEYGRGAAVIAVGPAGEMGLAAAALGITDGDRVPARHAARGGLAAVMGCKNLKAVVIDPGEARRPEPTDPAGLKAACRRLAWALLDHSTTGKTLPEYGTAVIVNIVNNLGGLPTRNYSEGVFAGADEISGETLRELIQERDGKPTHACMPGCVIRCSNVVPEEEGGELNRALEYETITLLGSNCGIDDLDVINRLNKRCDQLGVDTIEVGAAIGVAMEAGLAAFGDGKAAMRMVEEIGQGTWLGRLLGSGAQITGETLGVDHIPVVKGQAMAAYDPRVLKGTGVTYATSPMGADHTAGNALPGARLPDGTAPDVGDPEGQLRLSRHLQQVAAVLDTLGLCWFSRPPILDDFTLVTDLLEALYGGEWTREQLFRTARGTLRSEVEFNRRAGLVEKDDLPGYFRTESLEPTGSVFDVDQGDLQNISNWLED